MKRIKPLIAIILVAFFTVNFALAQEQKDIVSLVSDSKDHSTLDTALKAAGLSEILKGAGPFTIFAPTNTAFSNLSYGTLAHLMQPASKAKLVSFLNYHIVEGKLDVKTLQGIIAKGNGKATLKTLSGQDLKVYMTAGKIVIEDTRGQKSTVTGTEVKGTNGVLHEVAAVLVAKN